MVSLFALFNGSGLTWAASPDGSGITWEKRVLQQEAAGPIRHNAGVECEVSFDGI
jgi:hypothetical protein